MMKAKSKPYSTSSSHPVSLVEEPLAVSLPGNYFDYIRQSRHGVLKKTLIQIAEKLAFSLQELGGILHISERTLQRYRDEDTLATDASEKAVMLTQLYKRGSAVFGSAANFNDWMRTPLPAFRNEAPVRLLDTSFGFQLIFDELGRIEYGVFA